MRGKSRTAATILPTLEILGRDPTAFEISVRETSRSSEGIHFTVTATYHGAEPRAAALRVTLSLPAEDPWWLIPGLFYGENCPLNNDRAYPRFEIGATSPPQHARFVSDEWHFRSDRAATPVVMVWPQAGAEGLAISAAPVTCLGLTGLGLRGRAGVADLMVTFPAQEAPVSYYGDERPRPGDAARYRFDPGEEVVVKFDVHRLPADRHGYAPLLRHLHLAFGASAPLRPWVEIETAANLASDGLLRWHYDPDPGVLLETVGFDREVRGVDGQRVDRQAMHIGWVSGIPWATALLRHSMRVENDEMRVAAERVLDFCTAELSPSGTFWGVWYRDRGWSQSWTRHRRGLHSRTLGEANHFLVRAVEAVHTADVVRPADVVRASHWREAACTNFDVILARQRRDGNLGSIHHAESGAVLSWAGCAGLAWVGALVEASRWDARYLRAAERAGRYYAQFVHAEHLHGAPEDVDLAVTSEDGYVALMAYLALHQATGDQEWLDLARRAADFALTFRYTYDVEFAPGTMLSMYDFGTRGADQASASNQHLHAYGLVCTRELLQLADAAGDEHYRVRALETLACFRQFIARFDGDFNAYRGMVTERYYQTDCFQPKGMLLTLSHAWSVGVLLQGCEDAIEFGP